MLVKTFLGGLVVIWAYAQNTIYATEITILQIFNDSCRVIAATSHQDGYTPLHFVDNEILDLLFLLGSQRRRFARSSKNAEEVCTIIQLVIDQAEDRFIVNRTIVLERGNQRDTKALKNIMHHKSNSKSGAKLQK